MELTIYIPSEYFLWLSNTLSYSSNFKKIAKLTNLFNLIITEPYAGVAEAVRLDLQQQMVHGYLNHSVLEQEGSVRGEDPEKSADNLLPRVHR